MLNLLLVPRTGYMEPEAECALSNGGAGENYSSSDGVREATASNTRGSPDCREIQRLGGRKVPQLVTVRTRIPLDVRNDFNSTDEDLVSEAAHLQVV